MKSAQADFVICGREFIHPISNTMQIAATISPALLSLLDRQLIDADYIELNGHGRAGMGAQAPIASQRMTT